MAVRCPPSSLPDDELKIARILNKDASGALRWGSSALKISVRNCVIAAVAAGFIAAPAHACTVPSDLSQFSAPLPHLAAAVRGGKPVTIVALGSSSTKGAGASNPAKSYPARLQDALHVAWPKQQVQVINAGINGQLATDMVARIDKDVVARKPQLVIWQTGVNDAIKNVPVDTFKLTLRAGVARLLQSGADVVLVDHQFYPRFETLKSGPAYLAAIREIAAEYKVPLVQRYRIMKYLVESHQFSVVTMLSADQFHLNDRSYDCLGKLLSEQLRRAADTPAAAATATTVRSPL